ncbi:flagellar biosynthesis protein FlhB [Denitromonas iodatirespirans]|uniref:Flagellar biosynthetic protein FlhB n=1 Tax=Denitromonas iodatirespirans TaxID=2795389 RepID=A0A944D412_DENI1|nr:flagellar biosynthesis protein FlhB [Denitromonas iodatirespirans]MBT0959640.1 flagellar type III secretion system protein FlhB [Denitromonas iodatirespirans]
MAEESDLEKTEPASPRRLEQAREEGQVPQSRELSTFLVMMAGVAALWMLGQWVSSRIVALVKGGLSFERELAMNPELMVANLRDVLSEAVLTVAPVFAVLMVAAIAAPIMMGGLVFSPKALQFKFDRMDPLKGLERMFSVHGLAELVKALLKAILVGGVGAWAIWREKEHLLALMSQPLAASLNDFAQIVMFSALLVVSSLALLALLDVPFQLWQYHDKLKMTKEQVRQEHKESEGDPQLKARIRQAQREMARRRMMSEVPKADVVVTNPTHYAVALRYDAAKMGAPVVVAKGSDLVAQKIREIAAENNVPLLEAPPLARALYAHCEIEQSVPATLYTAVAEVMAYVYQLNQWLAGGGQAPEIPRALPVPADMDPGPGRA